MSNENSGEFVSVGCKLPAGLHLDLKNSEGAMVRHTLKGANASRIVGGFGITDNIPDDFMRTWLKKNAKHPAVVGGSIFIHKDAESAVAIAKERRDQVVTGLEPIDPIKSGVLRGPNGEVDSAALAHYNEQKAKNPERGRQQAE